MNKAATAYRWLSGRRSTDRLPQHDPADMGTAFGLDLSLLEMLDESPQAAPAARRPGWVQRLAARRKPAG